MSIPKAAAKLAPAKTQGATDSGPLIAGSRASHDATAREAVRLPATEAKVWLKLERVFRDVLFAQRNVEVSLGLPEGTDDHHVISSIIGACVGEPKATSRLAGWLLEIWRTRDVAALRRYADILEAFRDFENREEAPADRPRAAMLQYVWRCLATGKEPTWPEVKGYLLSKGLTVPGEKHAIGEFADVFYGYVQKGRGGRPKANSPKKRAKSGR